MNRSRPTSTRLMSRLLVVALAGAVSTWPSSSSAGFRGMNGRIVYDSYNPSSDEQELFIADANGGNTSNLSDSPSELERSPAASPDGAWIAFTGEGGIWVMRAD